MRISAATAKWPLVSLGVLFVQSCIISASSASLMTTDFATRPIGNPGPDNDFWRGSVTIDAGPIMGNEVEAVVEWAAFSPVDDGLGVHNFQLFLNDEHPGAVSPLLPLANEFIYAYQVVSVTAASPGISTLTVGVDAVDTIGSVGRVLLPPASVSGTGDVAPSGSGDQGTSVLWSFGPGAGLINAGESSEILVFSSPFTPQLDTMQLNSGLAGPIPSPMVASISEGEVFRGEIPEPASLALFALGLGAMVAGRRLRK